MKNQRSYAVLLAVLGLSVSIFRSSAQEGLVISEFLAINTTTVKDDFGQFSDYVEIYNGTGGTLDLSGYYLTDALDNLTQWKFPNTNLVSGRHLLVWASGRDIRVPGKPLHSNFKLSSSGEAIALVKPDAVTVVHQYIFGPQIADRSYGLETEVLSTATFLAAQAAARYFVPTNNSLSNKWTAITYDDSGWSPGITGFGFDADPASLFLPFISTDLRTAMQGGTTKRAGVYIRIPIVVDDLATVPNPALSIQYDDGFVMYLNGREVARRGIAASAIPNFSSLATLSRSNSVAVLSEEIPSLALVQELHSGTNILAVQAFNKSAIDSDLLMLPQLITRQIKYHAQAERYFATPSPGAGNAIGYEGSSGEVEFSVRSTPFFNAFELEIKPTTLAPLGEIRYTINASTPTTNSFLYKGPIVITNSFQIRARLYEPGFLPGPVQTEAYAKLSPAMQTVSSDLPLLLVHSFGANTRDETVKQPCIVFVHQPLRGRSSFTNAPDMVFRAGFKLRGSSTVGDAKSNWAVDAWDQYNLDTDIPLLGMPSASEWVFHAPFQFDPSLLHNPLASEMSNGIGRYAGRYRFTEIYLNDKVGTNALSTIVPANYFGVYNIIERIGVRPNRLNIAKLTDGDVQAPEVTGGYLMSVDRDFGGATQDSAGGIAFNYIEPKFEVISQPQRVAQRTYLVKYLNDFEKAFNSKTFTNTDSTGYSGFIDRGSWIDFHIVNEFSLNVDALRLSTYFYKDRNGPISFGPVWDFDRAFGSTDGRDADPLVWDDGTGFFNYPWWGRLFADVNFWQAWIDRYQDLREGLFSDRSLFALIDMMNAQVVESAPRDLARWSQSKRGGTQATEIAFLKNWLGKHTAFMDGQLLDKPDVLAASGQVASGAQINLSGPAGATIYYTLDGSDPRELHGPIASNAKIYSGPIVVDGEVRLVARARDPLHKNRVGSPNPPVNSIWSGLRSARFTLNAPAQAGELAVTELNYHPADPTAAELTINPAWSAEDFEFIEILNTGSRRLDLFGSRFTQGITFTFDDASTYTLDGGARILLVRNPAAFTVRYGNRAGVAGTYLGSLNDGGDSIRLVSVDGTVLLDFNYNDVWYPTTAGLGFTLVRRDLPSGPGTREAWRSSASPGGSPGVDDPAPANFPQVAINEVLANSDAALVDTIELINLSASAADITGWYLSDDPFTPKKYRLPAGSVLSAGGFLKVEETQFGSPGQGVAGFQLSSHGDEAWLFAADSAGNLLGYSHGFRFGPSDPNVSFGRYVLSTREEVFVAQSSNSFGRPNEIPKVGPIVITSIHYHPSEVFVNKAFWDNDEDEYIEIQNISTAAVSFFDSSSGSKWHLRGGVDFDFPTNFALPAGGRAVIVGFNPSLQPDQFSRFKSKFALPDGVPVLGGFQGHLDNGSAQVRIAKPGTLDADTGDVSYILVDEVDYKNTFPWPTAADGASAALSRKALTAFGNDPANWVATLPSPGRQPVLGAAPQITEPPQSVTVVGGTRVTLKVGAQSDSPLAYQWRRDGVGLPGAREAQLVLDPVTLNDGGTYVVVVVNASGSAESSVALLTVIRPATIVKQPQGINAKPGTTATFSVFATGKGTLRYQWLFKGKLLPGATDFTLTLSDVQLEDSGPYTVVVTDSVGSSTSDPALLNVLVRPTFVIQPQSVVALQGETVVLGVKAEGLQPISYRWKKGFGLISGATNSVLRLSNVQPNSSGLYAVIATNLATGASGTNSLAANLIVMADADQDGMGDSWELERGLSPADASDAARDDDGDGQTNLQEFIAGTDPKDKESVLRIDSIDVTTNGTSLSFLTRTNRGYTLQFRESLARGTWLPLAQVAGRTNEQLLTVKDLFPSSPSRLYRLAAPPQYDAPLTGPRLLTSPSSQAVDEGETAIFEVQATGVGELLYQWAKEGTPILGANAATLTLSSVQLSDAASYQVQVTDDSGNIESIAAQLVVLQKPTLTRQPQSQSLKPGDDLVLSVAATGAGALTYQWLKDNQPIPGAVNATLTLTPVSGVDAGDYRVVVKMATINGEQRRSSNIAVVLVSVQ